MALVGTKILYACSMVGRSYCNCAFGKLMSRFSKTRKKNQLTENISENSWSNRIKSLRSNDHIWPRNSLFSAHTYPVVAEKLHKFRFELFYFRDLASNDYFLTQNRKKDSLNEEVIREFRNSLILKVCTSLESNWLFELI